MSKKTKRSQDADPTIHLLGIYPKAMKAEYKRDTCIRMFIEAWFTITKVWKQLNHPLMDE